MTRDALRRAPAHGRSARCPARALPAGAAAVRSIRLFGLGLATVGGLAGLVSPGAAPAAVGYYRYPDLHGDTVVFTCEGDLWTAGLDGTGPRRLTSHPGDEILPVFSPDGKWIAFTGSYDGNDDVFAIPAGGGEPRRLTWHPAGDYPTAWSDEGTRVIFRSWRDDPHRNWALYSIPLTGGDPERLPVGYALNLSIDPSTGSWAFNRTGGGGTWKRYRGGTAADIWVGHPLQADFRRITTFEGNDLNPMWLGGRIWFLSDLGGTMNLWSIRADGSDRRRHTGFDTWDARQASSDGSHRIVFTLAGDIHLFDTTTGSEGKIPIELPSERFLTRTRYPDPQQYVTGLALAPEGDRVAVEARGEIFSVPAEKGVTLPISRGSGVREDRMSYDPTGERILYVTDETGEEAIATADAWGRGEVKIVVPPGKLGHVYPPVFSPDGKWIAWSDPTYRLWIAPAEGGAPIEVDRSEQSEIRDYAWSPDGRWLAYSRADRRDRSSLYIYDTKEKMAHGVSDLTTDDRTPAWDPDGRYLYFVSDRVMNPVVGWTADFESLELSPSKLCALLLRPDVENPVAKTEGAPPGAGDKKEKDKKKSGKRSRRQSDQGGPSSGGKHRRDSGRDDEDDQDDQVEPIAIDFDGITGRYVELPIEAGRYWGLAATSEKLFYFSAPLRGLYEEEEDFERVPGGALLTYDLEERESKPFLDKVVSWELQAKSGKIAVRKESGEIYVLDAGSPPGDDLSKRQVSLGNMVIELDPREEWRQMFLEAWRNLREFYWDPGMGGVDWAAIRDQYATLLPRLSVRSDLHDLIAEMIGELATSHTYVWGGDRGMPMPSVSTGLLGADLVREDGAFRVSRIHRGAAADRVRSPLDEPGSVVKEGEYILAVNNAPVPRDRPFESSLAGLAGKPVLLTVNGKPTSDGARTVVAVALGLTKAQELLYHDWVRRNREYVAEKTDGRIGYLHIPDMGGRGLKEFDTWFYQQLDKDGMVVDARWNGGGFVSQLIVSRFLRRLLWWDRARGGGVSTYPYRTLNGPFVVLTNEFAGSDGDIFPEAVQTAKLAPVIGKRSWGGVIGIRGGRPLVDRGEVTSPEFAWWHPQKGWGIENHGVDPDIVVENLPQELARGVDAQLDRGISEVLRLRTERPPLVPEFGPARDRSRRAFADER